MNEKLKQIMSARLTGETKDWLEDICKNLHDGSLLTRTFMQIPRKIGRSVVASPFDDESDPQSSYSNWSTDRICRVYLLASYQQADQQTYHTTIEQLYLAADLNELVALYSALPFLSWPESWTKRCAEGIRSNIGNVLEAIMYQNPYPAKYLEQAAWNQMILKAFFTEKNLDQIPGLTDRNNQALTRTLADYVHERWAAGRSVDPMIWLLIGQFAESAFMCDFEKVWTGSDETAKKLLAEGIRMSDYDPAKQLINPEDKGRIQTL